MSSLLFQLKKFSSPAKKKTIETFYKRNKGEYAEKDIFLGVYRSDIRRVAKDNSFLPFFQLKKEIQSKYHEVRLCALLILMEKNNHAIKKNNLKDRKKIIDFYIKNIDFVNNWDLVDLSASPLLGHAIFDSLLEKEVLLKLANFKNLWKRRISIVATHFFIRRGNISLTLEISDKLLADKEELIQKAVGWMLREAWKYDSFRVEEFLKKNYKRISRLTLRYAIERMSKEKRKTYLHFHDS